MVMRESRNPFRLRVAEQIESDSTFLRLFEPAVLDVLPDDALSTPFLILRSAPGGGKTSVLRLFTPAVLNALTATARRDEYDDIAQRLSVLGALAETGPQVIGIRLSCAPNYAGLDDLVSAQARADRLFFALLNARVLLAAVKEAAAIAGLDSAADLHRIGLRPSSGLSLPGLTFPCNGNQVMAWAAAVETQVCNVLDSFDPPRDQLVASGHESLTSLSVISHPSIELDGAPLAQRPLLMLDDVHLLTSRQRRALIDAITRLRPRLAVWLAERYEVLSVDELLTLGAQADRDYKIVYIEKFWRAKSGRRLEGFLKSVADRRAQMAADAEIRSFEECLGEAFTGPDLEARVRSAAERVESRVRASDSATTLFREWIEHHNSLAFSTAHDRLIKWRALEILMERERKRSQLTFELPLAAETKASKDGADVHHAAELFAADEFKLPYYYGAPTIAALSSSNVEQYLALAGDLFEEVVAAALLRRTTELSPLRQEAIVSEFAERRWREIPNRVPGGRRVRGFLEAAAKVAQAATYRPTAPYSPGVTGIAFAMRDQERLQQKFPELATVIASAIADNLLEPVADYECKGSTWMVLYFNRLLCARFRLPLGYGGFREQTLERLQGWLQHGLSPRQAELLVEGAA